MVRQRSISLNLYSLMLIVGTILTFARVYFNFFFSVKASKNIHKAMTGSVLNAMMTFFDSHYIGNIVNRFSKDLYSIDEIIPLNIYEMFRVSFFKFFICEITGHIFLEHLPVDKCTCFDYIC